MKKTILKAALTSLILAAPVAAFAVPTGLIGDCYDCHTMHNSEQNAPVAIVDGAVSATPIENLLRMDCIACHANDPTGGTKIMSLTGGSKIPQVMHADATGDLAGGNWFYMADSGSNRKGHNVRDLKTQYGGLEEVYPSIGTDAPLYSPPGLTGLGAHSSNRGAFTETTPFDMFTCAGARGCHGTRSQMLTGSTGDWDDNTETGNTFEGTRRTGMAAISGAHHNSYDGAKDSLATNYLRDESALHDGQKVADSYRFIPGLKGYGNDTAVAARWQNVDASSHNEYFGVANGVNNTGTSSCHRCHIEGHDGGNNTRAAVNSTLTVINNSMSGFCANCHGGFHSAGGAGADSDTTNNGVSGAFLRHPSDYVLPTTGEYADIVNGYDGSALVARNAVLTAPINQMSGAAGDMVMCLSCHIAHGSPNDYMLRFDYSTMTAGAYTEAQATAAGGCLACHTEKGVLVENR
jgi:predicted CXXCH cytochrome family protein